MKNVTEAELWELVLHAGEAQAKLADLQLKLISLTKPETDLSFLLELTHPPPVLPEPAPKDKDVPF